MDDSSKIRTGTLATLGFILPFAVAHLAKGAVDKSYERVSGKKPPKDPTSREVPWSSAIGWAVVAGVTGSMAKLLLRRTLSPTAIPVTGEENGRDAD